MAEAELPEDETERVEALHECAILDTLPEQVYDDVTTIASRLCGTPIALVSLVDGDRQWFKSRVGLDVDQTPRALAFCSHAILDADCVFVVPDAQRDARFADNPLVTGAPKIRFYAGAPLVTSDGHALGTLCVIDRKPRELTEVQLDSLDSLSRQVVAHLELRRTTHALEHSKQSLAQANRELSQRGDQLERSRDELAQLCRMLEVQADFMERDLQRAEVIQRSLLPHAAPSVSDACLQALHQPGHRIGGDLYDAVGVGERHLGVMIADAAGHGVSAAMLSVLYKQRLQLLDPASGQARRPAEVLDELNRSLQVDLSAPGVFVTSAIALLDARERRLWFASAGHPPALILRADGSTEKLEHTGPALGLYADAHYEEIEVDLFRGDRLLLYTDGLLDLAGDDDLDLGRVAKRLHALRGEKNALETVLEEFADGNERDDFDDVTLLLLEAAPGESRLCETVRRRAAARGESGELHPIHYGENAESSYLALRGRVHWMHGSTLHNAAIAIVDAKRPLDIDLAECEHLDSTLLGTLHEIVERADAANVPLRLCAPSPRLVEAFAELSMRGVLEHVSEARGPCPPEQNALAAPASDPRAQQLRLLQAHEVLAELSDENRSEMGPLIEAVRSGLVRR